MNNEFKQYLLDINKKLEQEFKTLFPNNKNEIMEAIDYLIYEGGKRLRPFIFLETCKILNIKNENLFKIACAIECAHNYSLVHDDLPGMDNDDYRRGKLTIHKKFSESTAILVGDSLLTFVFEILSSKLTNIDPKTQLSLISNFSKTLGFEGMCLGQLYDMEYEKSRCEKTIEKTDIINELKTGKMFNSCVEMAILLSQQHSEKGENLLKFIECFGVAFQLKDDLEDNEIIESNIEEVKNKLRTLVKTAKGYLATFPKEDVVYFEHLIEFCNC